MYVWVEKREMEMWRTRGCGEKWARETETETETDNMRTKVRLIPVFKGKTS